MLVECPFCEAKVDAKVLFQHKVPVVNWFDEDTPIETGGYYRLTLLDCPVCGNALLAGQDSKVEEPQYEYQWDRPKRVWPQPEQRADWRIPEKVRSSLEEAERCYKGRAYGACAVMCRRALEGICAEHSVKERNLVEALRQLQKKGVVDQRIYEWGEALREHGNIGAHVTEAAVSEEDARNLLRFARAICDYVFVLAWEFEEFMRTKQRRTKGPGNTAAEGLDEPTPA